MADMSNARFFAVVVGASAATFIGMLGWDRLASLGTASASSTSTAIARNFSICSSGKRTTCVVDGDTFWLDGVKIRIADIDTPEIGQPKCEAERERGQRATRRLGELLNAGPFELKASGRDEDRYGRKLRVVVRGGKSIGDQLVAEGLARTWSGRREPWC